MTDLIAIGGVILALILGAFGFGWKVKNDKVKTDKLKEFKKNVEAINEVPFNSTRTDSLERLRKSGDVRD